MDCPYCAKVNEPTIRKAFETRTPVRFDRIENHGWDVSEPDRVTGHFFCDACGGNLTVVVMLQNEPDPADWWKRDSNESREGMK